MITYRKFQFIKLFYILSEFYYNNVDNAQRYQTTEFFINLYEYFISTKDDKELITEREKQIIEAICIRIMFEYPINDNFYEKFNNKKKKKHSIQQLDSDFSINSSYFRSSLQSHSSSKNPFVKYHSTQIQFNFDFNEDTNEQIENKEFYDYQEYERLLHKLCISENNNDYTLRSIFLVILENNNRKYLTAKQKVKFISKNFKFHFYENEDLFKNFPYTELMTLSYYNKEIQQQMMNIALLYERNIMKLTLYSYEMYLFFLLNITKNHSDKCSFNHFINSKRVNTKILLAAFTYYKNNSNVFISNFNTIIETIIPFSRHCFIYDFIYQLIILGNEDKIDIGQQQVFDSLINWILANHDKKAKYYKLSKIHSLLLLYKLVTNKKLWKRKPPINIESGFFVTLFQDNLTLTKCNVLYESDMQILQEHKKEKTFIETIYDLLLKLFKLTNNNIYLHTLDAIFHEEKLLYDLDYKFYKTKENSTLLNMLFNNKKHDHSICSVPSFALLFLIKNIYYYNKMNTDKKTMFKSLAIRSFHCVTKLFGEVKETKGEMVYKIKTKDNKPNLSLLKKKTIYNECKKQIEKGLKQKTLNDNNIISTITEIINKHKELKEYTTEIKKPIDGQESLLRLVHAIHEENKINLENNEDIYENNNENDNESNLNDSFSSCKSSKSVQRLCSENKEKKMQIFQKGQNKKNKEHFFNLFTESSENKEGSIQNERASITNEQNLSSLQKDVSTSKKEMKYNFDITHIKKSKNACFFPTSMFIKRIFGTYFKDVLFYDYNFVQMQKYFKYYIEHIDNNKTVQYVNINNYLKFPSIIKNYIPKSLFYNGLFMRREFDFFTNEFFAKTHSYYIEQAKQLNINSIFKRKSTDDNIDNFVNNNLKDDTSLKFLCELITNKNVIFGEITLSNSFIYFKNKNKGNFFKNKKQDVKENFLLCSNESDLSTRNKRILIFIEDICEILNRRFLYQFQACEIFLKNGKSYFFNLFNEDKKIEFFASISFKKSKNKIITDLKGHFREKEYSKLWQQGSINNLQYLLFINKYASRSYNDTNQYPVLPWLKINKNIERNLQYSTAAQTNSQREYLLIKYDNALTSFRNHFNIHFSNSSFVIYYLVRINPFTNGQITLQNGKFDSPNRQFNSLEDCLNILEKSQDGRELIPHFFLNQDFFYNYNCNYFGFRERTQKIVHELTVFNKEQELLNSKCSNREVLPITFISQNAQMLNSQQVRKNIHHFINNIFGVRQVGKRDDFNTYDKYCYQEMINLRGKIEDYKLKNFSYDEMKTKIDRKKNKVLSFGQTPYKIFEVPHPPFTEPSKKQNIKQTEVLSLPKQKILFIKTTHLKEKEETPIIYTISFLNSTEFNIQVYDTDLKELKKYKTTLKGKIKLLTRLYLFTNSSLYALRYNPKFSLIDIRFRYFIACRFTDNTFVLYDLENISHNIRILTESYITTITKKDDNFILTGHYNGKIIMWHFPQNYPYPNVIKSVMAHKKAVNSIVYNDMLGLIISSGNDNVIYIRKFFDFEILGCVDIGNSFVYEMKIRNCYLYTLAYNEKSNLFYMRIFTLNGICVYEGENDLINNFDIDDQNRILVGYYKKHIIKVYTPDMKTVECEIDLNEERKKKGINENENEIIFKGFMYIDKVGIIAYFSNSDIMKIPYNI